MLESNPSKARALLQPPPRALSPKAAVCALFGSFMTQFGWFFVGFGLIFFWIFGFGAFKSQIQFQRPLMQAQAMLEAVTYSNARVNRQPVMGHHYSFEYQGKHYTGISYATGQSLQAGQVVPVEFVAEDPKVSRVTLPGMRASTFDGWVAYMVLIFPLAGLLMLLPSSYEGLRMLKLMRQGRLLPSKLIGKQPTGSSVKINGRVYPVYKLTFAYKVNGKLHETVFQTHRPEALEDEAEEDLLHLPEKPEYAIPVDAIPGRVYVDSHGQFCSDKNVMLYLLLPVGTVLLNALILLILL